MSDNWLQLNGPKRVLREHKNVSQLIQQGVLSFVHDLELVENNIMQWRFKMKNFDSSLTGANDLNADLELLRKKYNFDHLLVEVTFPDSYPSEPFFMRIVKPRCKMFTGHVTVGGAICIEALTLTGSPGSWISSFNFESMIFVVLTSLLETEVVWVETPAGNSGLTGPLRIDFSPYVMTEYSLYEAKAAFKRLETNHKRLGWGHNPAPQYGR